MDEAAFDKALTGRLEGVGIQDEAIFDYICSMVKMDPEDMPDEDKKEAVMEFLSEATEEPLDELVDAVLEEWAAVRHQQAQEEKRADDLKIEAATEATAKLLSEPLVTAGTDKVVDAEEVARKKALVKEYFISESESEPEEFVPGQAPKKVSDKRARRERKAASAQDIAVNFENTNRTAVADRARAKQAARHQAEVDRKVRDKAANKADKDAKAKAKEERKKKAVKGERRR